ncbi:unnamed protein product [Diatraea saccharalis]|uniref:Uncharacterized protein n=1 Tax=Diatraea saccharalis TaxID=40085 RepID=A0A9N9R6I7_9NEOP|nr:unnamed protein product [Diatraea saccharalis]
MFRSPQMAQRLSGTQKQAPTPSPRRSLGSNPKTPQEKTESKPREWGPDMDRFWEELTNITSKLSKALEVLESQATLRKDTKEKLILTLRKTKEKSKKMEDTVKEIRSYIEQQEIRYGIMERDIKELKKEEDLKETIEGMKNSQEEATIRMEKLMKEWEERYLGNVENRLKEIEEGMEEKTDEWEREGNTTKNTTKIIRKLENIEDNLTAEIIDIGRRMGEKIEDNENSIREKIEETGTKIEEYAEKLVDKIDNRDKESDNGTSINNTLAEQCLKEIEGHLNDSIIHAREEIIAEIRHQIGEIETKKPSSKTVENTSKIPTYAEVIREQKNRVPKTLHSLIIKSTNPNDMSEDVIKKVKNKIDAKKEGIKVDQIRKCKDQRVIIGCEEKEQIEKIEGKLKIGKELKIEKATNKDPLVVLKDVFKDIDDEELIQAIQEQNKCIFEGLFEEDKKIKIKFKKSTRRENTIHIALQIKPSLWQRMTGAGYLHIDLQRVRVEDQSPVIQCTKCLEFGHGRKFCTASATRCSHCGGSHLRPECPDREGKPPRCCNCLHSGLPENTHNAFSKECPIRAKWDFLARATTAYE